MSDRNKIWVSILVSIILFIILFILLPNHDKTLINIFGILGLILSLLGIVIAYLQILSVKEIAKQTKDKVSDSILLNNTILMISDLSRKTLIIDEIQRYLKDNKIELCILRMKDLKLILNSLKSQEQYNYLFRKSKFNEVFQTFNIDLDNCHRHHLNDKSKINKESIIKNLEELSTILLTVEIKLKNITYD